MFLFLQNKGTAEACRVQIFLNTAWMAGSPWCLCWSGGTALNRRVWVLRLLCMDWHPVNLGKPSDFSISVSSFVKWGVWNKYSYVLFAPFTEFRIRCHLRKEKKGLKKKTGHLIAKRICRDSDLRNSVNFDGQNHKTGIIFGKQIHLPGTTEEALLCSMPRCPQIGTSLPLQLSLGLPSEHHVFA